MGVGVNLNGSGGAILYLEVVPRWLDHFEQVHFILNGQVVLEHVL